MPKSNDSVVSCIATLYSGNCYAPLDTKNPIERIKSILEVLKPSCILTNSNFIENLRKCHLDVDIINIDEIECFNSENKGTYLYTSEGRNYLLDVTLDHLEDELEPHVFFRISRK